MADDKSCRGCPDSGRPYEKVTYGENGGGQLVLKCKGGGCRREREQGVLEGSSPSCGAEGYGAYTGTSYEWSARYARTRYHRCYSAAGSNAYSNCVGCPAIGKSRGDACRVDCCRVKHRIVGFSPQTRIAADPKTGG